MVTDVTLWCSLTRSDELLSLTLESIHDQPSHDDAPLAINRSCDHVWLASRSSLTFCSWYYRKSIYDAKSSSFALTVSSLSVIIRCIVI